MFGKPFLNDLTSVMNDVEYGPNEVIYLKHEIDNRIFFIFKGEVMISYDIDDINRVVSHNKKVIILSKTNILESRHLWRRFILHRFSSK